MSIIDQCAGYFTDVSLKYHPCLKKLLIYCCTPGNRGEKEFLAQELDYPSLRRYIKPQSIIIKGNTGDLR